MNEHFARLSPEGEPERCLPAEWQDWLSDPAYNPYLARERFDKWKIDLVFSGFWIGEGAPKFYSVSVNPPLGCGDLWQFECYQDALEAHGRVLAACRRESEREAALVDGA